MELEHGKYVVLPVVLSEFVGTCLFEVCYNLNDGTFPNGLALAMIIMIISSISGGHCNPATSLAVYINEQNWGNHFIFFLGIMLCQFFGAFAGLGISYLLRTQVIIDEMSGESIYVPS
jgi:glycerol uptake facilitator-like aquaporin